MKSVFSTELGSVYTLDILYNLIIFECKSSELWSLSTDNCTIQRITIKTSAKHCVSLDTKQF